MSLEISCGYLHTIQRMADDIWADSTKNNDLIAAVETPKAILQNQSVRFEEVTNAKNNELRVEWLTKCDISVTDCTNSCDIDGVDADPTCKDYEITCLFETSYKVPLKAYRERDIEMQESLAFNKLVHMKALDERIAQYVIAGLVANAGTNLFTGGVGGTPAAGVTYIAPQYWDENVFGYWNQVMRINKFRNAYGITGNNLYQLLWKIPLESGNANGSGAVRKIGTLSMYQDPENIEAHAPGDTFLINKGSVALLSKAWNRINGANAAQFAGQYWNWSEQSMNLPGIWYDMTMKETCEDGEYYRAVTIKWSGLFATNPYPCDEDNTGILLFECGTA